MATGYEVQMYRDVSRIARALERIAGALDRPTPVVLTIRDPDHETVHVADGDVRTVDVDLGSQFDGPKDFDPDADWAAEWIDDTLAQVADLPADSAVRRAVEDLVEDLRGGG
jgi:hypothetical protein